MAHAIDRNYGYGSQTTGSTWSTAMGSFVATPPVSVGALSSTAAASRSPRVPSPSPMMHAVRHSTLRINSPWSSSDARMALEGQARSAGTIGDSRRVLRSAIDFQPLRQRNQRSPGPATSGSSVCTGVVGVRTSPQMSPMNLRRSEVEAWQPGGLLREPLRSGPARPGRPGACSVQAPATRPFAAACGVSATSPSRLHFRPHLVAGSQSSVLSRSGSASVPRPRTLSPCGRPCAQLGHCATVVPPMPVTSTSATAAGAVAMTNATSTPTVSYAPPERSCTRPELHRPVLGHSLQLRTGGAETAPAPSPHSLVCVRSGLRRSSGGDETLLGPTTVWEPPAPPSQGSRQLPWDDSDGPCPVAPAEHTVPQAFGGRFSRVSEGKRGSDVLAASLGRRPLGGAETAPLPRSATKSKVFAVADHHAYSCPQDENAVPVNAVTSPPPDSTKVFIKPRRVVLGPPTPQLGKRPIVAVPCDRVPLRERNHVLSPPGGADAAKSNPRKDDVTTPRTAAPLAKATQAPLLSGAKLMPPLEGSLTLNLSPLERSVTTAQRSSASKQLWAECIGSPSEVESFASYRLCAGRDALESCRQDSTPARTAREEGSPATIMISPSTCSPSSVQEVWSPSLHVNQLNFEACALPLENQRQEKLECEIELANHSPVLAPNEHVEEKLECGMELAKHGSVHAPNEHGEERQMSKSSFSRGQALCVGWSIGVEALEECVAAVHSPQTKAAAASSAGSPGSPGSFASSPTVAHAPVSASSVRLLVGSVVASVCGLRPPAVPPMMARKHTSHGGEAALVQCGARQPEPVAVTEPHKVTPLLGPMSSRPPSPERLVAEEVGAAQTSQAPMPCDELSPRIGGAGDGKDQALKLHRMSQETQASDMMNGCCDLTLEASDMCDEDESSRDLNSSFRSGETSDILSDVDLQEVPQPMHASIRDEDTTLQSLKFEDIEKLRREDGSFPWELPIYVPEGVAEDRRVRVVINNMQLEATVPENCRPGDEVNAELCFEWPLEPWLQRKILLKDIMNKLFRFWDRDSGESVEALHGKALTDLLQGSRARTFPQASRELGPRFLQDPIVEKNYINACKRLRGRCMRPRLPRILDHSESPEKRE